MKLELETRTGLPESLRKLVSEYPRDLWEEHTHFDGLVRFWLERHQMFRKIVTMMQQDHDGLSSQTLDPVQYKNRVARFGNLFVGELHTHHTIEDHHYFPKLQQMETSLIRGFEILDTDHHALERHLEDFTQYANAVLEADENTLWDPSNQLRDKVIAMEGFLNRHLTDEEELVVPVILKHGFEA